ncbi:type II secretion system protein [Dyella acidisoli]|uniref:Prepilin-type N-terminal cleavage/methylation domain-containing protein n=1 Tax=Dyella acidisoli TaxID=1867834 RepID=A0ABQ5XS44_9GAMM|nr:type II secretion system protein [Dyella acidisoli]GLQ94182.1 hypothetical protein GCM10007901_31330 [Dyella acidisoli]
MYSYRNRKRTQRGDVLLEALIAVLVMSFIGAGTLYATTRMEVGAKNARLDGVAASQMRLLLQQYGSSLCPGQANSSQAKVTLPLINKLYTVNVQCPAATSITVGGVVITQPSSVVLCIPHAVSDTVLEGTVMVGTDTAAMAKVQAPCT